mgnify:CR=1 FL=1
MFDEVSTHVATERGAKEATVIPTQGSTSILCTSTALPFDPLLRRTLHSSTVLKTEVNNCLGVSEQTVPRAQYTHQPAEPGPVFHRYTHWESFLRLMLSTGLTF